jgi:stress response protein YsnF
VEHKTYEFVETAEELAIEKQLVVREEIVLTSRVHEHVEDVTETVRRTEVEIERTDPDPVGHSGRKR